MHLAIRVSGFVSRENGLQFHGWHVKGYASSMSQAFHVEDSQQGMLILQATVQQCSHDMAMKY